MQVPSLTASQRFCERSYFGDLLKQMDLFLFNLKQLLKWADHPPVHFHFCLFVLGLHNVLEVETLYVQFWT